MILYEVNLEVSMDIFKEYMSWLNAHIGEMLKFRGFKKVSLLKEIRYENENFYKISVQYHIDDTDSLDDYLNNHAARMRDDGLKKFSNKFSATRRFFEIESEILQ